MDDKKKTLVLAALFVVMAGVGVFQFTKSSGSDEAQPTETKAEAKKSTDAKTKKVSDAEQAMLGTEGSAEGKSDPAVASADYKNPVVAKPLAERDPFLPLGKSESPDSAKEATKPPEPKPAPTAASNPKIPSLPPMQIDTTGALPGGSIPALPGAGHPGASTQIAPESKFGFTLKGLILGDYPAAVFVDASGNEKLVSEGGSIDGDATLISVSNGSVKVSFRGKTLKLTPGGN